MHFASISSLKYSPSSILHIFLAKLKPLVIAFWRSEFCRNSLEISSLLHLWGFCKEVQFSLFHFQNRTACDGISSECFPIQNSLWLEGPLSVRVLHSPIACMEQEAIIHSWQRKEHIWIYISSHLASSLPFKATNIFYVGYAYFVVFPLNGELQLAPIKRMLSLGSALIFPT